MRNNEFFDLWCDPEKERTVVITDVSPDGIELGRDELLLVVCFPPDVVVTATVKLRGIQPF